MHTLWKINVYCFRPQTPAAFERNQHMLERFLKKIPLNPEEFSYIEERNILLVLQLLSYTTSPN
jgi:hypothetical protein